MKERLYMLRKELGLSQEKFGERIGLQKTAISRMEKGIVSPTPQTIKLIVSEYNVEYAWLTEGTGAMFRDDLSSIHLLIDQMMAGATDTERKAFHDIAKMDTSYWVAINNFIKSIKK